VADRVGKSWAVVIGIDEYETVAKLRYAATDAKAVGAALESRGFQVVGLYDQQATRGRILSELGDRLVDRVGEGDRVLIFFAGHGVTKTAKGGKTMGYLVPVEGKETALAETALSMTTIRDLADALPAKHVQFVIDVCYGGIAGTQGRAVPPMTEGYLREITREKGRQLIAAGGPNQQALEGPEWGHSVFTYYLLEGLEKGLADLNEDGIIPASELYAYLDARVFGAASLKGHTQRPQKWNLSAETGEFVFFTSARAVPSPGGLAPAEAPTPALSPVEGKQDPVPGSSAALSRAEQELKRLEEQERQQERQLAEQARQVEEQQKLAWLQKQEEQKLAELQKQIEEKKKNIELAKAYGVPQQAGKEITGKDGAPMVLVPAGQFRMGSMEGDADEKPVHRVVLDAFYLDKYEVTNQRFQQIVRDTGYETTAEEEGTAFGCTPSNECKEISGANWRKPEGGETVFVSNRDEHPVVSVSWYDAEAYCRWAGKRLPTEAEFEYANRGGTRTTYWWGDGNPGSRRVANIMDEAAKRQFYGWAIMAGYDDGYARTAPVGSFEPNPFGLHDTTGNVWEWTADWYGKDYYERSTSRNPTGPSSGEYRILRGGSWFGGPQLVRSAYRFYGPPVGRKGDLGFRCAKTP
jgi:formylglycine-generating enzyme required for sulfatase activity